MLKFETQLLDALCEWSLQRVVRPVETIVEMRWSQSKAFGAVHALQLFDITPGQTGSGHKSAKVWKGGTHIFTNTIGLTARAHAVLCSK